MLTDELRALIARLEPEMRLLTGTFTELEIEAGKLVNRLDRTFVSDIADVEALLLAALVERLRRRLRNREQELQAKTDLAMSLRMVE